LRPRAKMSATNTYRLIEVDGAQDAMQERTYETYTALSNKM